MISIMPRLSLRLCLGSLRNLRFRTVFCYVACVSLFFNVVVFNRMFLRHYQGLSKCVGLLSQRGQNLNTTRDICGWMKRSGGKHYSLETKDVVSKKSLLFQEDSSATLALLNFSDTMRAKNNEKSKGRGFYLMGFLGSEKATVRGNHSNHNKFNTTIGSRSKSNIRKNTTGEDNYFNHNKLKKIIKQGNHSILDIIKKITMRVKNSISRKIKKTATRAKHSISDNINITPAQGNTTNVTTLPVRSMAGKYIGVDFFKDVILPSATCKGNNVKVILCVTIKRDGWNQRKAIRNTWGSWARLLHPSQSRGNSSHHNNESTRLQEKPYRDVLLVFFIGNSTKMDDKEEQTAIEQEARMYGDIYQANFLDTYQNLTLKSISMLRFVSLHCPNVRFVVKVDDDVYLNVPLLLSELDKLKHSLQRTLHASSKNSPGQFDQTFLFGVKFQTAPVDRNKRSKYYLEKTEFRESMFPAYLSGTTYAMSISAALALYTAALEVPFLAIEDIYITGLCRKHADVTLVNDWRFVFEENTHDACTMAGNISSHKNTVEQLFAIHSGLMDPALNCTKETPKTSWWCTKVGGLLKLVGFC